MQSSRSLRLALSVCSRGLGWQLVLPVPPTAHAAGLCLAELNFQALRPRDFVTLCCCKRFVQDSAGRWHWRGLLLGQQELLLTSCYDFWAKGLQVVIVSFPSCEPTSDGTQQMDVPAATSLLQVQGRDPRQSRVPSPFLLPSCSVDVSVPFSSSPGRGALVWLLPYLGSQVRMG